MKIINLVPFLLGLLIAGTGYAVDPIVKPENPYVTRAQLEVDLEDAHDVGRKLREMSNLASYWSLVASAKSLRSELAERASKVKLMGFSDDAISELLAPYESEILIYYSLMGNMDTHELSKCLGMLPFGDETTFDGKLAIMLRPTEFQKLIRDALDGSREITNGKSLLRHFAEDSIRSEGAARVFIEEPAFVRKILEPHQPASGVTVDWLNEASSKLAQYVSSKDEKFRSEVSHYFDCIAACCRVMGMVK